MKYSLNKNDTSKLHKLFDTYDENIAVADAILYFLNTEDNLFENIDKENIYDEFIFRLNADAEYDQLFKSYFPFIKLLIIRSSCPFHNTCGISKI